MTRSSCLIFGVKHRTSNVEDPTSDEWPADGLLDVRSRFAGLVVGCSLVFILTLSVRAATESLPIRLNTVGYLPSAKNKLSIASPCKNFAVIRVADGSKVFNGKVTGPVLNPDTQEQLYTADFSQLNKPGDYQLDVPGVGRSAPFHIAPDVYREPITPSCVDFIYGAAAPPSARRITAKPSPTRPATPTTRGWIMSAADTRNKDGTKGWHDAGDYNKYTVNAGITVGSLFRAWEDFGPQLQAIRLDIPESGGQLPDFLAELKWEMDWVSENAGAGRFGVSQTHHETLRPFHHARGRERSRVISLPGAARPLPFCGNDRTSRPDLQALRPGLRRSLSGSRPTELQVFEGPPGIS